MATPHTTEPAEINLDVPCSSCGYNLRGLAGDGRCPECGAAIARSLEIHLNPILPAQILWARSVLAGLITWLLLTPACLTIVLHMGGRNSDATFFWTNYPGPKLWAVCMARLLLFSTGSALDSVPQVIGLIGLLACFLMTAPHPRARPERLWSLRRVSRWYPVLMGGGLFGVCLTGPGSVQKLICLAILLIELPGTVLIYQHLAALARQLDLPESAVELRLCGLVAGVVILASGAVLLVGLSLSLPGQLPVILMGFWLAGAIAVGTAIVAYGNLLRLAMALWPIAMVRLRRRSQ